MENSTKYWTNLVRENRRTFKILLYLTFGIILLLIISIIILAANGYQFSTPTTVQEQPQDTVVLQKPEDITMETKE